jgi:hypothetical protein
MESFLKKRKKKIKEENEENRSTRDVEISKKKGKKKLGR